jgi:hypothetical protein
MKRAIMRQPTYREWENTIAVRADFTFVRFALGEVDQIHTSPEKSPSGFAPRFHSSLKDDVDRLSNRRSGGLRMELCQIKVTILQMIVD